MLGGLDHFLFLLTSIFISECVFQGEGGVYEGLNCELFLFLFCT